MNADVFARTMFGVLISLLVGLRSVVSAALVGLLIGVIAGYSRSFDNIAMRIVDDLIAITAILLAIVLRFADGRRNRNPHRRDHGLFDSKCYAAG
ncbi:hypothetical protein OWC48_43070 [Bradyrhizobium sp. Arg816]|nr:hypothetical protein [Bradyrhizobium sp. Arg816]MDI3567168.1 hypothetical protein [Bradyrhizobium sp. Arg816]